MYAAVVVREVHAIKKDCESQILPRPGPIRFVFEIYINLRSLLHILLLCTRVSVYILLPDFQWHHIFPFALTTPPNVVLLLRLECGIRVFSRLFIFDGIRFYKYAACCTRLYISFYTFSCIFLILNYDFAIFFPLNIATKGFSIRDALIFGTQSR